MSFFYEKLFKRASNGKINRQLALKNFVLSSHSNEKVREVVEGKYKERYFARIVLIEREGKP